MKTRDYQDFIDFVHLLKSYYETTTGKLQQGEFVRMVLGSISNAYIKTDDDSLARYMRDRSIYKSSNKSLLTLLDKRKFEKWIHNKHITADALKLLANDCRLFVNSRPARFSGKIKKEVLALCTLNTVGKCAAEIFVNILSAPDPQGRSVRANTRSDVPESDITVGDLFDKQASALDGLKAAHGVTHQGIEDISRHTKITPSIATGVSEANIKLDEIKGLSSRLDKFDSFVEAQTSAGLNAIVYSILGENISKYSPTEYEWMAQELKLELVDQLNRAVLNRLPDEALDDIEECIGVSGDEADQVDVLIQQKIVEHNIDVNTIAFDTIARFVEFYKHRAFTITGDSIIDAPHSEPLMIEALTQEEFDNYTDDEKDTWLNKHLGLN